MIQDGVWEEADAQAPRHSTANCHPSVVIKGRKKTTTRNRNTRHSASAGGGDKTPFIHLGVELMVMKHHPYVGVELMVLDSNCWETGRTCIRHIIAKRDVSLLESRLVGLASRTTLLCFWKRDEPNPQISLLLVALVLRVAWYAVQPWCGLCGVPHFGER